MKKFLISTLMLLILAGGIFFFLPAFENYFRFEFSETKNNLPTIAKLAEREIFTPPPLRSPQTKDYPQVILIQKEVIEWTNLQREKNNLPQFKENSILNAMAKAKIEDMFEMQYFDHYSPLSGKGVGDLANQFGYEFFFIGENLALGNFENEKELVEAWMASPGHRENILSLNYQEIGVAVEKGIFEGKTVWLAVQHFGLPLSVCPQPDESIKLEIEQKGQELKKLEEALFQIKADLQKIRPKWSSDYQEKLKEHNDLVEKYNDLLLQNKKLVENYNTQIQEYNQCLVKIK